MKSSLYTIVYCSRNLIQGSEEQVNCELQTILASSRKNNPGKNVSGALLYNGGSFAQVLEGPLDAIGQTFERIQRDPRHSEVTVIQSGPITERQFGEWSMAFAGNSSMEGTPVATAAFEAVFSRAAEGGEQMLTLLQGLIVSEDEWVLLDVA